MEKTLARILGLSHTPQRSLREYADFLTGFPACQALSAPGTCSVPRGFFMKEQLCLVREALSMIWYHSLYPWHCSKAYTQFMVDEDYEQPEAVKAYNPYDLYSKSDEPPKVEELKPHYEGLIAN